MALAQPTTPCRENTSPGAFRPANIADLKLPGAGDPSRSNTTPTRTQPERSKQPEQNPSHFAPENPTKKELAKERWYTRAAWATIATAYSAALFGIKYGEGEHVTRSAVTGLLLDTCFSYLALKNSELRRFILEGAVLPNPVQSDTFIRRLLGIGALFQFLGGASNTFYSVILFTQADYTSAIFRGALALTSTHLGFAWWRRFRFFGAMDSH